MVEETDQFGIDEDLEEIHKMLDENDYIDEYLSSVKELQESVVTAVSLIIYSQ